MKGLQLSLFPNTLGDFVPDEFETSLEGTNFENVIVMTISQAFDEEKKSSTVQRRVKSTSFNERFFRLLQMNLLEAGIIEEKDVEFDFSGNKKNNLCFKGYSFILEKANSTHNNTKVTNHIENQQFNKHIIQIRYDIDKMWTKLISVCFAYCKGGDIIYSRKLKSQDTTISTTSNNLCLNDEVSNAKISLKPGLKKKVVNDD